MKKLSIASIALCIGCLIYVFWRSETLTMFIWFEWLGIAGIVKTLRNFTHDISIYFTDWFLYSFPNALWLFSGILIFDSIWGVKWSASKLFWYMVFLMIAIGSEIGQGLGFIPGTFDLHDMTLMALASFCAFLFITILKQKERRQEF